MRSISMRVVHSVIFLLALTGCGGSSALHQMPPALPAGHSSNLVHVKRPLDAYGNVVPNPTLSGTINSVSSTNIGLNAGSACGNVNVAVSSATLIAYNGLPLASGTFAQIVATGNCNTSFTASEIILAAPITLSGPITGIDGSTIGINAGSSCGYMNATMTGATTVAMNGQMLAVGTMASVSGIGSCNTNVIATSITLSGPAVQATPTPAPTATPASYPTTIAATHVFTADYLGGYAGTKSIAWSQAAPYLNWAETSVSDANSIASTGIKTMDYSDPNYIAPGDPLYSTDETIFAHTCSGARISRTYNSSTTQYLSDPSSADLAANWNAWAASEASSAHFDAFFEDDANNTYGMNALPCNYTAPTWATLSIALDNAFTRPIIYNNLSGANTINLNQATSVIGGMSEECYSRSSQPTAPFTSGSLWTTSENLQIAMGQQHKLFLCYNNDTGSAATEIAARLYTYASFLLTYDASTSVLWNTFATASGFHVLPEATLVPAYPLVSQPSGVSSLQAAGGAYGREYAACYLAGTLVGRCAVAVNPDPSSAHAFPFSGYAHSVTLSGSGVLDGGSISTSGGAPPASLASLSAVIAFQ